MQKVKGIAFSFSQRAQQRDRPSLVCDQLLSGRFVSLNVFFYYSVVVQQQRCLVIGRLSSHHHPDVTSR